MEQQKREELLIGIGGTGASVIKQIQQKLAEDAKEQRPRFICIDTDSDAQEKDSAPKQK